MIVKFNVNYGGYIGAEDEYEVYVDDDATEKDIYNAVHEEFLRVIEDNCSYEITDREED